MTDRSIYSLKSASQGVAQWFNDNYKTKWILVTY